MDPILVRAFSEKCEAVFGQKRGETQELTRIHLKNQQKLEMIKTNNDKIHGPSFSKS